jgi:cell division protein FtsB
MPRLKLLFIAGILTAVLIGYVGPVQAYVEQRAELAHQRETLAQLDAKRDRLERQAKASNRPDVLEAKARDLGLIKPGERAYVIRGLPEDKPARPESSDDGGLLGWIARRL